MTLRRWLRSVAWLIVWLAAAWYATIAIDNAWGLVILAALYISMFCTLVNTVDLVCGRWIRRGVPSPATPRQAPVIHQAVITAILLPGDQDEWPRPARRD